MDVRVRFAPSPSGYLHIGGARTALFNWLFARHHHGIFILRIEDTDVERSSPEMVQGILEGMRWLGLDWEEGPFLQSQRLKSYHSVCQRLLQGGKAYRCFCTPDQSECGKPISRETRKSGESDGTCRDFSPSQIKARLDDNQPFALRFKVPTGLQVEFNDRIFGAIQVASDQIEDFVIQRSDGRPTYHLSVVADDTDMEISHVIRGADHLPNTGKHVLLYQALQQPAPVFVHLPLILGSDRKRLSKRHGATSVLEYKRQGFVPSAIRNYLALLGWSPGCDREFFTSPELIQFFDLDRINKANAVFDPQKLEWMNGQHIARLSPQQLMPEIRSLLQDTDLWDVSWDTHERDWFLSTLNLLKPRARRLTDFVDLGKPFFTDQFEYARDASDQYLSPKNPAAREALVVALEAVRETYQHLHPFDLKTTEDVLRAMVKRHGIKAGDLFGAVRVALTGKKAAPGLFDVIVTLGKERTTRRLERVLRFLQ